MLPVLADFSNREVGRRIGRDPKTVAGIRRGANPHRSTQEKLWKLAIEVAESKRPDERTSEASALIAEAQVAGRNHKDPAQK